ncbi:hypothetical protein L1987_08476 [Smallanthus sonchifolius]|uniref:Uncharacterized protein n=1 Tax=Smallanthus sonchifolius TaxID=185202 RepID=A0ACB9JLA3_9ASTR|nr:hypothetical protein L1987_08476 [Smallanthus sonchifolius]
MSYSTSSTHILVCPFAPSGHFIPLLDLTRLLLRRGLTITIVISDTNLPLLDPLLSSHPSSIHKLRLSDPDHSHSPSPSPHPLITKVIATRQLFDPIFQWFKSHPTPPAAIISDFFLGWTNDLASHLGVRHMFSPSGALGYSIFHMLWRDASEINALNDDRDESFMLSFPDIPNSPELPWWQLSPLWRSYKKGEPGLEGGYIDYVKKQMGHDRVWAVGPLLPDEHDPMGTTGREGSSAVPLDDLLMWLAQKRDGSVVYICFGGQGTLSEKEMKALTGALKLSNVDFVLCVQEGVASGVMMLTWPMGADQFANAALRVDQLGVVKRICGSGPESVPDSVELAQLLDESLNVDRPERVRAKPSSHQGS